MKATTLDLVSQARRDGYGVLAFNVIGLDHAEAIVRGAEMERSPVILQVSQNAIRYRYGQLEPLVAACREVAAVATVPVGLHLDHATTRDLCERAIAAGMSSVMFDDGGDARGIARTREIVALAHAAEAAVEGEIGFVGGKDGTVTTADGLTDPASAVAYVEVTGVDLVAVSVGSEHGMSRRTHLDLDRIGAIRDMVSVPLVLHGSSGVPDDILAEAVRRGISKVNMATQLNAAWTGSVRNSLGENLTVTDPRRYGAPAREAMVEVVRAKCRLVGASGRTPSV